MVNKFDEKENKKTNKLFISSSGATNPTRIHGDDDIIQHKWIRP